MKKIIPYLPVAILLLLLPAYLFLGNPLQTSRNRPSAVQTLEHSNPAVVKLNQAGLRYFNSKQYELARDQFKAALELSPDHPALLKNLAYAYYEIGREKGDRLQFDEALSAFEKAIQADPRISSFHAGAGWAYDKTGQEDHAIRELEEAVRLNPQEAEAYRITGEIYYKMDNSDKAIEALEKALSLHPEDEALRQRIAKIREEKKTESDFERSSSHHFIIKFEGEENKEIAQKVSDLLEEAYRDIGSVFYDKSPLPVIAILYSDQSFRNTVHSPVWAGGVYDGKIRIPVQGSIKDPEELKRVLYHEYTHAVLYQLTSSPIPTWLNEGLAMYFEGNPSQSSLLQKVEEARQNGSLIPLHQLQGSFMEMDASTSALAYGESKAAVQMLIDRYSVRRVRDLLNQYKRPETFPAVFEEVFLIPYEQFEKIFANP